MKPNINQINEVINSIDETLYGMRKRLSFFLSVISQYQDDISILDVGCGTGEFVTSPIARLGYSIVGIDSDSASIEWASRHNTFPNCIYIKQDVNSVDRLFDIIILSEVLEHVPDPRHFLKEVRSKLKESGVLILTVPNGYGPFELEMKLWRKEFMFSVLRILSKVARFIKIYLLQRQLETDSLPLGFEKADTLNKDSGHINFFSLKKLRTIYKDSGFQLVEFKKRTVLCGPYTSLLFNYNSIFHRINASIANIAPAFLVSDWMFILKSTTSRPGSKMNEEKNLT